jgi:hypothetical protein
MRAFISKLAFLVMPALVVGCDDVATVDYSFGAGETCFIRDDAAENCRVARPIHQPTQNALQRGRIGADEQLVPGDMIGAQVHVGDYSGVDVIPGPGFGNPNISISASVVDYLKRPFADRIAEPTAHLDLGYLTASIGCADADGNLRPYANERIPTLRDLSCNRHPATFGHGGCDWDPESGLLTMTLYGFISTESTYVEESAYATFEVECPATTGDHVLINAYLSDVDGVWAESTQAKITVSAH